MKTSLILSLSALFAVVPASALQTIHYPEKQPFFSITFPDDWIVATEEQSISASSADELVNMELIALEAEALDGAIDLAKKSLREELEGIEFSKPEQGRLNGMNVTFLNGHVAIDDVPMSVNCCVFEPVGAETFFMLFNLIPNVALKKHGDEVSTVINSIRSRTAAKAGAKTPAETSAPAAALDAKTTFAPWSYTEKDLFPSALVSTATVDWNGDEQAAEDRKAKDDPELRKRDVPIYGDENGWLAVELTGLPKGAQVEAEISIEGFMKPSKWKGTVTKISRKGEARVFPKAVWDYEALLQVRQQRPVNVSYKVTVNGNALHEINETYVMKSINDCPFYVLWDEDGEEFDDFSWLFAAYVNENHPEVDVILKESLASGLVGSFDGYQSEDPKQVMMQVFAVWNALQRRGIKYSDVSTTTPSKFVVSQTVRFLDDSIAATQANCVDGSVLMASVLQKIGIHSYLVMVPGHCFLAFDSGKGEDDNIIGLETTMLGNDELKPVNEIPNLPQKMKLKEFQASYRTFSNAVKTGNAALEENAEAFDSAEDPGIQLISIAAARELGIMPIPSTKAAK